MNDDVSAASDDNPILLIDRQVAWRDRSVVALEAHGYAVRSLDGYEYPPADTFFDFAQPSLVILGCTRIGPHEQHLIDQLLLMRLPLVVLCSSLSEELMRALFLAGVKDAAVKPYDGDSLVALISQIITSFTPVSAQTLGDGGTAQ